MLPALGQYSASSTRILRFVVDVLDKKLCIFTCPDVVDLLCGLPIFYGLVLHVQLLEICSGLSICCRFVVPVAM